MSGELLARGCAFLGHGRVVLDDLGDLRYAYVDLLDAVCLLQRGLRDGVNEACRAFNLFNDFVQCLRGLVRYLLTGLMLCDGVFISTSFFPKFKI